MKKNVLINNFFKIIRKSDIFSFPIKLYISKKSRYQSIFGGFVTLALLLFFFIIITKVFLQFNAGFYTKINFHEQDISTNEFKDKNLKTLINNEELSLSFQFWPKEINDNYDKLFKLNITQIFEIRNSSSEIRKSFEINLEKCDHANNIENLDNITGYCIFKNESFNLYGDFDQLEFAYLKISIYRQYESEFNKELLKNLKDKKIKFRIFFKNSLIDLNNGENPVINYVFKDFYSFIDPRDKLYKRTDFYFDEIFFENNENLLPTIFGPNKKKISQFLSLQEIGKKNIFSYIYDDDSLLFNLYLRKSKKIYHILKDKGDFLSLISFIGGLWYPCYLPLFLIMYYYNRIGCFLAIGNKIYNYPKLNPNSKIPRNSSILHGFSKEKERKNNEDQSFSITKIINKIEDYLISDKKLKINFCETWFLFFPDCFLSKGNLMKKNLIKKTIYGVKKDLNIVNVINQLQGLERLKRLILNRNQLILFNFCPNPNLMLKEKFHNVLPSPILIKALKRARMTNSTKIRKKFNILTAELPKCSEIEVFKELFKSLSQLKNENSIKPEQINSKLIELLGKELSKIITLNSEDMLNILGVKEKQINFENKIDVDWNGFNMDEDITNESMANVIRNTVLNRRIKNSFNKQKLIVETNNVQLNLE